MSAGCGWPKDAAGRDDPITHKGAQLAIALSGSWDRYRSAHQPGTSQDLQGCQCDAADMVNHKYGSPDRIIVTYCSSGRYAGRTKGRLGLISRCEQGHCRHP